MPTIIPAASPAELISVLQTVTGGETIRLSGGNYGVLSLTHGTGITLGFIETVTLSAADPAHPPVFSGMVLHDVTNLSFEDVSFKYTHIPDRPVFEKPFRLIGALDICFNRCLFDGDMAPQEPTQHAQGGLGKTKIGYPVGFGLDITRSVGITLEDCTIRRFLRGLLVQDSDDITLSGNDLYGIRMEAMAFAAVQGVVIEHNQIHDIIRPSQEARIGEMIHFWTNCTIRPSTNIVIRNNTLDVCAGLHSRSIVLRNDIVQTGFADEEMFFRAIRIEDNLIANGHANGIVVGETAGLTICNNTVLRADGADGFIAVPQIHVAPAATGVTIRQNACAAISGHEGQADWQVEHNVIIQDRDPDASGWYEDVFYPESLAPSADEYHKPKPRSDGLLAQLQAGVDGQSWPVEVVKAFSPLPPSHAHPETRPTHTAKDAPISSEAAPALSDSDDLSISISFDTETAGRTGEIARLGDSFVATITETGALHITARSSTGTEASLTASDHCVNDGNHHEADIRLQNGQLELWLDGELAAHTAFAGHITHHAAADVPHAAPCSSEVMASSGPQRPFPKETASPASPSMFSVDTAPPIF